MIPYPTYHVLDSNRKIVVVRVAPGGSVPKIIRNTKTAKVLLVYEGVTSNSKADRAYREAEVIADKLQEQARQEYLKTKKR